MADFSYSNASPNVESLGDMILVQSRLRTNGGVQVVQAAAYTRHAAFELLKSLSEALQDFERPAAPVLLRPV